MIPTTPTRPARPHTAEQRQRSVIDLSKVRANGCLHGIKFDDTVSQILFTDVADAVSFAQRFVPARGVRVAIVPVCVTEKEYRR